MTLSEVIEMLLGLRQRKWALLQVDTIPGDVENYKDLRYTISALAAQSGALVLLEKKISAKKMAEYENVPKGNNATNA